MYEKIIFNGRVYNNVEEMSPDVQKLYEKINQLSTDANQDGVPDFIQAGSLRGIKQAFELAKGLSQISKDSNTITPDQLVAIRITDSKIIINGRAFDNVEEMPPEIRQGYERIVSAVDPGEFEIFDEPWREVKREEYFTPHDDELMKSQPQGAPASNVIEPVNSNASLFVVIAFICILCIAAAAWLILSGAVPGLG